VIFDCPGVGYELSVVLVKVLASENASEYAAEIRRMLERSLPPTASTTELSAEEVMGAWEPVAGSGWLALGLPDEDAGQVLDLLDLAEIARVWGRYLVAAPFITTVLARRWLAEAGADSPVAELTVAVPLSDGPVAPFGGWPGIGLVQWDERNGSASVTEVRAGAPEAGEFAVSLALVPSPGSGRVPAAARMELAALWAAEAIGGADAMLERAAEYARHRETYGHRIGSYQAVAHMLADMHRDVEFGWSGVVWASHSDDDSLRPALTAVDLAIGVIRKAIQVHGGIGFTWELGLHRYLRHSMAIRELLTGLRWKEAPNR
jgi:alkylation response protein AidB-like acyl-CoA dehydrogenase